MNNQLLKAILKINHRLAALRYHLHWPPAWGCVRRLLATVALALCLSMQALALINDIFSDVPASAFYHDAVNAIYRAGITVGCSAGLYCPDQAVTRAQMAVFLQRGLSRVAYNEGNSITLNSATYQDVAVVTVNTGGAPGQTGFVKLDAAIAAFVGFFSCPCEFEFYIAQEGGGASRHHYATINRAAASGALSWVVAVPTGTTQTFRLKAKGENSISARGELTATYIPFGSTGTNTLAAPPSAYELPTSPPDDRPELLTPPMPELPMRKKDQ